MARHEIFALYGSTFKPKFIDIAKMTVFIFESHHTIKIIFFDKYMWAQPFKNLKHRLFIESLLSFLLT